MGNKKGTRAVALVLATVMAVGLVLSGSFAWYDFTQKAQNVFKTKSYEVELVDVFEEEDDWSKNESVNKDVYVKNKGDGPVLVRLNMTEHLDIDGTNVTADKIYTDGAKDNQANAYAGATGSTFRDWTEWALNSNNDHVMTMADYKALTPAQQKAYTGWILDTNDGWFYWSQILESKTQTTKVLDAVKLLKEPEGDKSGKVLTYTIDIYLQAISSDLSDVNKWAVGPVLDDNGDPVLDGNGNPVVNPGGTNNTPAGTLPEIVNILGENSGAIAAHVDATTFPNAALRQWMSDNVDTNGDGIISGAEAEAVKSANLRNMGLTDADLAGVECLNNATTLDLRNNDLTTFDGSPWPEATIFRLGNNTNMTSVNVTNNEKLASLSLNGCTSVTSVDLSGNPNLESINISESGITSGLDLSNNPKVKSVQMINSNYNGVLDLRNQPEMMILTVDNNPNLTDVLLHPSCDFRPVDSEFVGPSTSSTTRSNVLSSIRMHETGISAGRQKAIAMQATKVYSLYTGNTGSGDLDLTGHSNLLEVFISKSEVASVTVNGLQNLEAVMLHNCTSATLTVNAANTPKLTKDVTRINSSTPFKTTSGIFVFPQQVGAVTVNQ